MAYNQFDDTLPVSTATGPQTVTDIRDNQQAMRDMIVIGGINGWDMTASGGTAEQPTQLLYINSTEYLKAALTWGSSGGGDGNVTQSVYSYSSDSGSNYDTIGTFTPTYDTDGNVTATAWSQIMVDYLLGVPGKLKTLLDRLTATRAGYLDASISSRASATNLATVDTVVDTILADTAYMQPRLASMPTNPLTTAVRNVRYGSGSYSGASRTYVDITMSAITNINKCVLSVKGYDADNYTDVKPTYGQVTSTTNVRVYFNANMPSLSASYNLTEFY